MKIGTSLFLVAIGLILAYAVDFEVPGLEVSTLGAILFLVGVLGLIVTVGLEVAARRAHRPLRPRPQPQPRREPARRDTYDPVIPLPARPRDPAREATQVLREPGEDETRRLPRR
ncbi:MAG: hypothetical protein H0V22_07310 [Solirubrobacterales bacterium]|jgi:hypothetical protein|nr:hypothetical protein [Solirubrobacterales bacterium]